MEAIYFSQGFYSCLRNRLWDEDTIQSFCYHWVNELKIGKIEFNNLSHEVQEYACLWVLDEEVLKNIFSFVLAII